MELNKNIINNYKILNIKTIMFIRLVSTIYKRDKFNQNTQIKLLECSLCGDSAKTKENRRTKMP
jgi:hypothetical protein